MHTGLVAETKLWVYVDLAQHELCSCKETCGTAGGAPSDRDGDRSRPDCRADTGSSGRGAALQAGGHQALSKISTAHFSILFTQTTSASCALLCKDFTNLHTAHICCMNDLLASCCCKSSTLQQNCYVEHAKPSGCNVWLYVAFCGRIAMLLGEKFDACSWVCPALLLLSLEFVQKALCGASGHLYCRLSAVHALTSDCTTDSIESNARQTALCAAEVLTPSCLPSRQKLSAHSKLTAQQTELKVTIYLLQGHSIECRINAEDPFKNFRPGPGRVVGYLAPGGPYVRMDSHMYPDYLVSDYLMFAWSGTCTETI